MCVGAHRVLKKALQDSQKLELQVLVGHPVWVLRTELKSSGRASKSLSSRLCLCL